MPELPEICLIARQMNKKLSGMRVENIASYQPKCLNRSISDYQRYLKTHKIVNVSSYGKWIIILFENDSKLNINLGMGGEICHYKSQSDLPEKIQFKLDLENGEGFFITLWWFGYIHLVVKDEIHEMTAALGSDAFQLVQDDFRTLLANRKGKIKSFLLNQKNISGIGNFYIQEILFDAKLHPDRTIPSLSGEEIDRLFGSIQKVFKKSIDLGSSSYELDYLGKKGKYGLDQLAFAYKENEPCPECGTLTQKIRTGTNAQYICPHCQKI